MEHLSVSFVSELTQRIRSRACEKEETISAWLADAAETKLALEGAEEVIADWEKEHGVITDTELAEMDELWRA